MLVSVASAGGYYCCGGDTIIEEHYHITEHNYYIDSYKLEREIEGVAATNAALSSLPSLSHAPNHSSSGDDHTGLGFAVGAYNGASAIAVGFEGQYEDITLKLNAAKSDRSDAQFGFGVMFGID
ncbi:MAG: YadA-like family protein [Thiomicrorhabdus sp.]|nr:YadA-like family protein [Thiomicrorhabdus sp.]